MSFNKLILNTFSEILFPLRIYLSDANNFESFLAKFGWVASIREENIEIISTSFGLLDLVNELIDIIALFDDPTTNDDLTVITELKDKIVTIINIIDDLSNVELSNKPFPLDQAIFWEEMAGSLPDFLTINYLSKNQPAIYSALLFFGVIEEEFHQPTTRNRMPYTKKSIFWARLGDVFLNPGELRDRLYHWGDNQPFNFNRLFYTLHTILRDLNFSPRLTLPRESLVHTYYNTGGDIPNDIKELFLLFLSGSRPDDSGLVEAGLSIFPIPHQHSSQNTPSGIVISPIFRGEINPIIPLSQEFYLSLSGGFELNDSFRFEFFPNSSRIVATNNQEINAAIQLIGAPKNGAWIILGSEEESRVEVTGFEGGLKINQQAENPNIDVYVGTGEGKLKIVIQLDEADTFIASLFKSIDLDLELQLNISWSSAFGFSLGGGVGAEIAIPINRTIGPLKIIKGFVGFGLASGVTAVSFGLSANARLGPLNIFVDNIGLKFELRPREQNQSPGVFGNLDLGFDFSPPTGLGITLDTEIISGGGFIEFDPDRGQYAGILDLELFNIGITAIGILDTKDAGGRDLPSPGYSFLIIILADLPLIQLGFGFTLNGVGGLLGIHRTTNTDNLKSGFQDGNIDSILFPENPLGNMPKIISDIRSIFPPQIDQFVFGPMLQIGWGTPTIFELSLGVILDLPDPFRLIILGKLTSTLPSEKFPIIVLNVDLLGILDLGRSEIFIGANIRDSRLAAFELSGGMAFLLNWGRDPNFILSIGGFHPAYRHAGNLPKVERLSISLGLGDLLYIGVQGYLAVTSNSFQFGARAELFVGVDAANIHGWLSFDALIIFNPFYFRFDYSIGLVVSVAGKTLAGITFTGILEGPFPFRIAGSACISILFIDLCVEFDFTIGEMEEEEPPLPLKDPWIDLEANIAEQGNWNTTYKHETGGIQLQIDKTLSPALLLHPNGDLVFKQNIVPLNRKLERFGEYGVPEGKDEFIINSIEIGGQRILSSDWKYVSNFFASGHFEELTVQEKLERDPFEKMEAGIQLISKGMFLGQTARSISLEYEENIIDEQGSAPPEESIEFDVNEQLAASRSIKENKFLKKNRFLNLGRRSDTASFNLEEKQFSPPPNYTPRNMPEGILNFSRENQLNRNGYLREINKKHIRPNSQYEWIFKSSDSNKTP